MQPWSLTFEGTDTETSFVEKVLEEGALSSSRFEKKEFSGAVWVLEVLFDHNPLQGGGLKAYPALDSFSLERFYCVQLPDKDWVRENRASFPPLEIGRFVIHGSHDPPPCEGGKVPLEIEASLAFGTGGHATTEGCLTLLESLEKKACHHILDLGCGTGLLAIAAAHIFPKAKTIHASDNDDEAVKMAHYNLIQNGLEGRVTPVLSDGFVSFPLGETPYDLILANILAAPLVSLASDMGNHAAKGAYIILSGLLQEQEAHVVEAYRGQGFKFLKALHLEEWSALLLQKAVA